MKTRCRFKVLVLALLAGFAVELSQAGQARAGSDPDTTEAHNWSGIYAGMHAGGAFSDVSWDDISLTGENISNDTDGLFAGGHLGVQRQFDSFVLGVEAAVSGAEFEDTQSSAVGGVTFTTEINTVVTVTGRLGYAFGRFLPYVKGGYAGADVQTAGTSQALADSFNVSDWEHGWTIGGGVEYLITENLVIGAEYSYIDLGDTSRSGNTSTLGAPFRIADIDGQLHAVTARISIKFDP
ncbi:MAG: outer membrane protein [Hyphomicrobiales bacterium]